MACRLQLFMKYCAIILVTGCLFSVALPANRYVAHGKKSEAKNLLRSTLGTGSCLAAAFCFFKAKPHVENAFYYSGGISYFLATENWGPLLKACWAMSTFDTTTAVAAEIAVPYWSELEMGSLSSWYESYRRMQIANACCQAAPWLVTALALSGYGIHNLSKVFKRKKKLEDKMNTNVEVFNKLKR